MRRTGFTLLELLIVIVVIMILLTSLSALFNEMFRGEEVREGGRIVEQAISLAREEAAKSRIVHFVKLCNEPHAGVIEIWRDEDGDRSLTGADHRIEGGRIELPRHCRFRPPGIGAASPPNSHWLAFEPTGMCRFNPGFAGVEASAFDANWNLSKPTLMGDVCLEVPGRPYRVGMDIDLIAGKIRRSEFLFIGK
jgi:prepilin-type N-terminal cleavage/methylation domain-containing protein